ncbi:MAG: hypothetical protein WAL61_14000 [Acidimicrobiales bacterium]
MKQVSEAMAELESANPFREPAAVSGWARSDEDALLARLFAAPVVDRQAAEPAARRRPRLRGASPMKRITLAATVAVMVGALALGLSLSSTETPGAFAAWTPTTTSPPAAQLAAADAGCQQVWTMKLIPPAEAPSLPATLPPLVLTDSRGPFEMLVYAGPSGQQVCLWDRGLLSISGNGGDLPPAGPDEIGTPGVGFDGGNKLFTYADGHAGAQVTAVTLVLEDGTHIQATLEKGLYAAWWPSKTDVSSAEVTTTHGTFRQHFGSIGPNLP